MTSRSVDQAFAPMLTALRTLDGRRERTPCQMPDVDHLWTSDNHEDREAAGHRCQPCPVFDVCADYAQATAARFHVWAGVDLTARTDRSAS